MTFRTYVEFIRLQLIHFIITIFDCCTSIGNQALPLCVTNLVCLGYLWIFAFSSSFNLFKLVKFNRISLPLHIYLLTLSNCKISFLISIHRSVCLPLSHFQHHQQLLFSDETLWGGCNAGMLNQPKLFTCVNRHRQIHTSIRVKIKEAWIWRQADFDSPSSWNKRNLHLDSRCVYVYSMKCDENPTDIRKVACVVCVRKKVALNWW